MIYLYLLEEISENDFVIRGIHNQPFDSKDGLGKTVEELERSGFLVDSIPIPSPSKNKQAVLHINPITRELWYSYEDPFTPIDLKIQELEKKLSLMQRAIDELIFGGMF